MKLLVISLFLIQGVYADNTASKILDVDGTKDQIQLELISAVGEGTVWTDVEVPDTCYRTENSTIPRTCHREESYSIPRTCQREEVHTTSRTCYHTATRRECRIVQPRYCERRCDFGRCRRVCYAARARCDYIPYEVPYRCDEREVRRVSYDCSTRGTREVAYSCPHTQSREVPYSCTRTERREIPARDVRVTHIIYIQLNLGNHPDLSEKIEVKVQGKKITVKQLNKEKYILEVLPVSSREENRQGLKYIHHDVIVDIRPE